MMKALRYASQLEGYFVKYLRSKLEASKRVKHLTETMTAILSASSGGLVVCDSLMAS